MSMKRNNYVPVEDKEREATQVVSALIGQRLADAQVFLDSTWHFYFGPDADKFGRPYLAVECCWRFTNGARIVIGSEDYDSEAKSAHRQVDTLRSLVGTEGLRVETVLADPWGGLRIGFDKGYVFDVFPASDREMEWMFRSTRSDSLVLRDGILYKSEGTYERV